MKLPKTCPKCGARMRIPCYDRFYDDPPGDVYYYGHWVDGIDCLKQQLLNTNKRIETLERMLG